MQLDADPHQLAEQVSALLADAASPSAALLQLALLCLQTGHPQLAARLACSDQLSAVHRAELDALNTIDLLSLYSSWKATCTAGWQASLTPEALLRLGLLLSRSEGDAMARLRSDLQEVFGEGMVQADRPLALQLWDQLCRRCPDWCWKGTVTSSSIAIEPLSASLSKIRPSSSLSAMSIKLTCGESTRSIQSVIAASS